MMIARLATALSLMVTCVSVAASRAASGQPTNDAFLRCWSGQKTASGAYRISFEAVVFPRDGSISASPACPGLRLELRFIDTELPRGFSPFQDERLRNFESVGISATGIVDVERRERSDLLVVRVDRIIQGRVLSPADTESLRRRGWPEIAHD